MKRNKAALIVTAAGIALSAMLTGCGGGASAEPAESTEVIDPYSTDYSNTEFIEAENVQGTNVYEYDNAQTDIIIFDIERDGETLTCATKADPASGVSCFVKSPR